MLTDWHVHLRPDDLDATPERWFTEANAARYRETAAERGIAGLGVSEHVYRFRDALEVWQHPFWRRYAHDDLDAYCSFVRDATDLALGIEADWIAGREDRMASLLDQYGWDYVIGSVHFVGDESLDTEEYGIWLRATSPDEVWRRYFDALAAAAESGLFDVLAHPDLVKVWGGDRPRPEGDLRRFYYPAMERIAATDVAIEVSTAGLRKPVGEIYPARPFLEMAIDAGLPLALSSDAHAPEHIGYEYGTAVGLLEDLGVREIAVFEGRERRMEPLG